MKSLLVVLLTILLGGCERRETPSSSPSVIVLRNATLVDVTAGRIVDDATIVIRGNRIASVAATGDVEIPETATIVDLRGRYVIPGLWDMHVHALSLQWYEPFSKLFMANGIAGFRDTWGDLALASGIRNEVEAGERIAPRFIVAGNLVDGPNPISPGSIEVRTPGQARAVVDDLKREGAAFVKVYSKLPPRLFRAIARRANEIGIPFAGHVPALVKASEASDLGQLTMEHLYGVLEGCATDEDAILEEFARWANDTSRGKAQRSLREALRARNRRTLETQDDDRCRALFERFVANRTWQVPTLVTNRGFSYMNDPELASDPRLKFVSSEILSSWDVRSNRRVQNFTEEDWELERALFARQLEVVRLLHRSKVPLLAGSDTPNPYSLPGFGLHDELELLVEAGLSPLAALRTATLNPAIFLERPGLLGTIAPGALADLVVLDENPLEDIRATREIHAVVLDGKLLPKRRLDALLEEVAAENENGGGLSGVEGFE